MHVRGMICEVYELMIFAHTFLTEILLSIDMVFKASSVNQMKKLQYLTHCVMLIGTSIIPEKQPEA